MSQHSSQGVDVTLPQATKQMNDVGNERYLSDDGHQMEREYGISPAPHGVPLNGSWVLRDAAGKVLGFDHNQKQLTTKFNFHVNATH